MIRPLLARTGIVETRLATLLIAAILYGALGSPTPDNPGLVEALIAILLLFTIGGKNLLAILHLQTPEPTYVTTGKLLALSALIIGLTNAAIGGHNISNILRDIIPFGFLLLPLLLHDLTKHPQSSKIFLTAAMTIGVLFSLRSLLNPLQIGTIATSQTGELLYLANMPTVLLSAILLIAMAAQKLFQPINIRNIGMALALLTLSILPVTTLLISLQRASIGGLLLALIILLILAIIKKPYKAARLFLPIAIIALYAAPFLVFYSHIIMDKTSAVGTNMRLEELSAIWQSISTSPLTIIFGKGWGATFLSPAVGNIEVTFSHSLLSSILLKLGLLGLALTCTYLWALFKRGWLLLCKNPVLAFAILPPILIDVFLYASFKSFDFGLILCLIPAATAARRA